MLQRTYFRRYLVIPALFAVGCGKPPVSGGVTQGPSIAVADQALEVKDAAQAKKETVAAPLAEGGVFQFTDDDGGKLLAKRLAPPAPAPIGPPRVTLSPRDRQLPGSIANPEIPGALGSLAPPHLPLPSRIDFQPMPLPDRVPAEISQSVPSTPERIVFPVGSLAKNDTPDVKQPTALPILARPTPDRASLEDPTVEFTAQSIINNNLPLRSTTAPFVKVTLPDPFENVEAAKVKVALKDDPLTAVGNLPPPKP
jgi:hypothetical protein